MKNMNTIQIEFGQNLSQTNSIDLDTNAILLALEHENSIKVRLKKQQTIEEINTFVNQIVKCLLTKTGNTYSYVQQDIVWGRLLENRGLSVVNVTYYLSNIERYE